MSVWPVCLPAVATAHSDHGPQSTVELEPSESITSPLPVQLAIIQELKERLFGCSSEECNIIELSASPYPLFFPKLLGLTLIMCGRYYCRCWNSDRLAGPCVLSTDLREFTVISCCKPVSFIQTRPKCAPAGLSYHNIRINAELYPN